MSFDIQETTLSFDHTNRELHIYTNRRPVFLALIRRNPNYTSAEHKCGGYFLVYPKGSFRGPEMVLKPESGGDSRLEEWLTPQEKANRQAQVERMIALFAT
ncbi:hypothetical protein [Vulcanococcus limneticus]|uniref:hypothetical protein n=1 Tax=Vulcanococcus limneticus TaxID=2170428 RepID=UPI00398C237A